MKFIIYLTLWISSSAFGQMQYKPNVSPQILSMMDSALTLFKTGNNEQAFSIYDRIIQLDSTNIDILEVKSGWELALKKYDKALQTILRKSQLQPQVARYQLTIGSIYQKLGEIVSARPYFAKVIRMSDTILDTLNSNDRDNYRRYSLYKALATIFNGNESQGNKLLSELYKYEGESQGAASYQYLNKSKAELLKIWLGER